MNQRTNRRRFLQLAAGAARSLRRRPHVPVLSHIAATAGRRSRSSRCALLGDDHLSSSSTRRCVRAIWHLLAGRHGPRTTWIAPQRCRCRPRSPARCAITPPACRGSFRPRHPAQDARVARRTQHPWARSSGIPERDRMSLAHRARPVASAVDAAQTHHVLYATAAAPGQRGESLVGAGRSGATAAARTQTAATGCRPVGPGSAQENFMGMTRVRLRRRHAHRRRVAPRRRPRRRPPGAASRESSRCRSRAPTAAPILRITLSARAHARAG